MFRNKFRNTNAIVSMLFVASIILSSSALACSESHVMNPGSEIAWETSYSAALQKAKAANKPIVLDLYTDWCHWCKKLDEEVWIDKEIIAFSEGQVYLKLNAEKSADGRELARKHRVRGFPTILILNSNGKEIGRIIGFAPAHRYLKELKKNVAKK